MNFNNPLRLPEVQEGVDAVRIASDRLEMIVARNVPRSAGNLEWALVRNGIHELKPAWDFQYIIQNPVPGEVYACRPREGPADVLNEVSKWHRMHALEGA